MKRLWLPALSAVLIVGGCASKQGDGGASGGPEAMRVAAADVSSGDAAKGGAGDAGAVPIAVPQLAYAYNLGFRLPADRIEAAQKAHLALCDKLGPAWCQMIAVSRDGDSATGGGAMKLRVATDQARTFAAALQQAVAAQGGRQIDSRVEAEDVSKDMVDAQARINQRTILVDRLTEILRTRDGKVGDLVEAERSVAQAQEELDQARGWLAELRQRVATSTFDLTYNAVEPRAGSAFNIGEALQGSGSGFVYGLQLIGVVLIYLGPWLVLIGLIGWGVRAFVRRIGAYEEMPGSAIAKEMDDE